MRNRSTRWGAGLAMLLGLVAPGARAQSSFELVAENTQINAVATGGSVFAPHVGATPGQFGGLILPGGRSVVQNHAQESSGTSLDPNRRRFVAMEKPYSWAEAVADAQARGGHVATITSAGEQAEMMAAIGTSGGNLWLAGSDAAAEGTWAWENGEPFAYSNWAPGEPNNAGDEDYLQLWRATGQWNDIYAQRFAFTFGGVITIPTLMGYVLEIDSAPREVMRGGSGASALFVESVLMGMPYVSKPSEFLIGSIIPPPSIDENENLLDERVPPVEPTAYWETQPLNVGEGLDPNHLNYGRFYFSPARNALFATRGGSARVIWVKRQPEVVRPGDYTDANKWLDRGGVYYRKFTRDYVIGASPVKRPRRIYWTEGSDAQGLPVYIPNSRIADLKIVYHGGFPEEVAPGQGTPVGGGGIGSTDPGASQGEAEIRSTLVYTRAQNLLRASNREGRVFVELLGPVSPTTGNPEHLGFEVLDVVAKTVPTDDAVDLGDPLLQPAVGGEDSIQLYPKVANIPEGNGFVYRHSPSANELDTVYFAKRETQNPNDLLVWWMIQGEQGILWPEQLNRYDFAWPVDPTKYSHYVRPVAATEDEARETAVAMPRGNSPLIEYQDREGDPRAKFTQDFRFYTFLDDDMAAHRTLLSFKSGTEVAFERVLSLRQTNLEADSWGNTVAARLATWVEFFVEENGQTVSRHRMEWGEASRAPRLVSATVNVGERIEPPEVDASGLYDYLAGYIHLDATRNDSYSILAYMDPFVVGFEEAAKGAILPVNAIPTRNQLKVYWFRRNRFPANQGFEGIYWPSIVGTYTLRWPHEDPNWVPDRIVLASNDGSGGLESLQAKGAIYVQNEPTWPGYNPNEEHALMAGGQAYALRDDLNVLASTGYSSEPYVLLGYLDGSGRPAMRAFRVEREDDRDQFVIPLTAGTIIQPPMPLPLMQKPVPGSAFETLLRDAGHAALAVNLNQIVPSVPLGGSSYDSSNRRWTLVAGSRLLLGDFTPLYLSTGVSGSTTLYFIGDEARWPDFMDGYVSEHPIVDLPRPDPEFASLTEVRYTLGAGDAGLLAAVAANDVVILTDRSGRRSYRLTVAAKDETQRKLVLSYSATTWGGGRSGRPLFEAIQAQLVLPSKNAAHEDHDALAGYILSADRLPPTLPPTDSRYARYALPTLKDRKGNLWAYRGPHLAADRGADVHTHWFYKTEPGFFFPSLATQPEPGTLTPYLRARKSDGTFLGPAVVDTQSAEISSFAVVYRITWPDPVAELRPGQTLAKPAFGLPAIRGNTSVEVLYEQSASTNASSARSVTLHDPTREKMFELGQSQKLLTLPTSILTSSSRGLTFFPNLPPHLVERFFLDPNRGKSGALVFKGEFKDEPVGEDYFFLNVAKGRDLAALKGLVSPSDENKSKWEAAIDGLTAKVETFREDLGKRGTYIVDTTVNRTIQQLVSVTHSDTAVDSYALSADQAGRGYVSLIMGNGRAFTPEAEPVSVQIIRVGGPLHRGEVKPIAAANPLAEKLTMLHTADLAGSTDQFEYDWRIAAPVDGSPPPVYEKVRESIPTTGWKELVTLRSGEARGSLPASENPRWREAVLGSAVTSVEQLRVTASSYNALSGLLELTVGAHRFLPGDRVRLQGFVPAGYDGSFLVQQTGPTTLHVHPAAAPPAAQVLGLVTEDASATGPQSLWRGSFTLSSANEWDDLHISLDLAPRLGVRVWIGGAVVAVRNWPGENDTATVPAPFGFVPLDLLYRVDSSLVKAGTHELVVEFRSTSDAGAEEPFQLRVEANRWLDHPNTGGSQWLTRETIGPDLRRVLLGESADVQALSDNYLIVRYRSRNASHSTRFDGNGAAIDGWSKWTDPALAEGWIKRVLAGINPFNQRVKDLFANQVDTSASILTQAGPRWEGNVALSLESINDFGLIEIYETVMNRGRMLSVDAGINYGPANDALLLAAGYINDLYMMLGNEAWADAANPTIGIGTKDRNYGDVATALFAFKGQMSTLADEELALLRGRDDFMQPGTRTPPVYNRLFWNYTRGIDSGEVIYALNYNIQEDNDRGVDGTIDADDARKMFPQGHGDAYGHYLTALKGYYRLLMSKDFTWVPRTEAVNILGKPVQVDYSDERKFAAAAAAVARTGKQVVDLTWRRDYEPRSGSDAGTEWDEAFGASRGNAATGVSRRWGVDHWSSRVAQGTLVNWVVGNAMLPEVDPDPSHEGIQKIDRMTVPELAELPATLESLQITVDNAEGGLNPLGLPEDSMVVDINPIVTSIEYFEDGFTHFEQVYKRSLMALQNASAAFDDAKDVTQMMRSEQDSLADFQTEVANQELAYKHSLIELYGTPYTDDIGPGKTYATGYDGPDFFHYMYVDTVRQDLENATHPSPDLPMTQRIDIQQYETGWKDLSKTNFNWIEKGVYPPGDADAISKDERTPIQYIEFNLDGHGFLKKPTTWTGRRASPGEIQGAISEIITAHNEVYEALKRHDALKYELDRMMDVFENKMTAHNDVRAIKQSLLIAQEVLRWTKFATETTIEAVELAKELSTSGQEAAKEAVPKVTIGGLAVGGDMLSAFRATITLGQAATKGAMDVVKQVAKSTFQAFENSVETAKETQEFNRIAPIEWEQELREAVFPMDMKLGDIQLSLYTIYGQLQKLTSAYENYRSVVAKGDRVQAEREIFRRRAAAIVQGFRTRDAAFRIFRNEKLERYKTLQDLASKYAYLAAKAYDYETGLLGTAAGKKFLNRIVSARALGVMRDGTPQYAGSNTGDPGLSSVLAEMRADFDVLWGRLGLNNPHLMGTTASLRMEHLRIPPNEEEDTAWVDALQAGRRANLLDDADVRRHCLGIDPGDGRPVPGIVLEFSTVIEPGLNLFGQRLAAGDHAFDQSFFATKLISVGVALDGYIGMDGSDTVTGLVGAAGGQSPGGSLTQYLNPKGLSANPAVYLIPVGVDTMRSPPLGDTSRIRTWNVEDVAIPLPFNIGASGFSTKPLWTSAQSLTEPLFAVRKHPSFRPVASADEFSNFNGGLQEYATINRLVGRSVWNSRWKVVIPGNRLLNDPEEGLNRLMQTVRDIKIHFKTYSYAGN